MALPLSTRLVRGPEGIAEAARLLRDGQIVAIPTETVYGLAASALDEDAVARIFEAKGRPQDNPLIVHVGDQAGLELAAREVPEKARALMRAFWPGPLSLILRKGRRVPDRVSAGLDTVAVRMPSHPDARAVILATGVPLAAPSANISGRPSPTSAQHVLCDLEGRVPLILDGGRCGVGVESTVVDMTRAVPLVLRPGAVTRADLEAVLGPVEVHQGHLEAGQAAPSPGLKYAHYRPRAEVRMASGDPGAVAKWVRSLYDQAVAGGGKPLVLCARNMAPMYDGLLCRSLGDTRDDAQRAVFAELRRADEEGASLILVHYEPYMGEAVRNRLDRAAAGSSRVL